MTTFEIKFSVYKQTTNQPTNQPSRHHTEKISRSAQQQARLKTNELTSTGVNEFNLVCQRLGKFYPEKNCVLYDKMVQITFTNSCLTDVSVKYFSVNGGRVQDLASGTEFPRDRHSPVVVLTADWKMASEGVLCHGRQRTNVWQFKLCLKVE